MHLLFLIVFFVFLGLGLSLEKVHACTGLYIGKKVSADGSAIIARSEDQPIGAYNKLFKVRPRTLGTGRKYVDTGDGMENFSVDLPDLTYKYTYVPDTSDINDGEYPACSTNEYGLAVIATVTAGATEDYLKLDPYVEPGIREAILAGLLACQCKTARDASEKLASLLDQYGSGEGNILFFQDQNESWIFEIYGGHNYAAMKMPEDKVAVFGNNFMLGKVNREDKENYIFSPKLFETLDKLGAVMEDGEYNIAKTISIHPREEGCNMRTWIGHKILAPSTVGEYSNDEFYPLFYTPDQKVTVETVMDIYRNRYEDTPYDMMEESNLGRRPIGITSTSQVHIIQTYSELPKDSCHLQWLLLGNAEHSVFIPAFSGITETFDAYNVDKNIYNENSMYFSCKRICTVCQSSREYLSQGVREYWKREELDMISEMKDELPKVVDAYKNGTDYGREYVTALGKKYAKMQFENSKYLFNKVFWHMIYVENDQVIKENRVAFSCPERIK